MSEQAYNPQEFYGYLETAITRCQEKARVRGDFMEAMFCVHHALNVAWDDELKEKGMYDKDRKLRFHEKALQVLPGLECSNLEDLGEFRNWCAHPEYNFYYHIYDDDIRQKAIDFINLAQQAWPMLYGKSLAPIGEFPPIISQENILNAAQVAQLRQERAQVSRQKDDLARKLAQSDEQNQQLQAQLTQQREEKARMLAQRKILWRAILTGLVLLSPIPLLTGFAVHSLRGGSAALYRALVPAALSLLLLYFSARHLGQFLRPLRIGQLLAAVAVGLTAATVALAPFSPKELTWTQKASVALDRVLIFTERVAALTVAGLFNAGATLADNLFPAAQSAEPEAPRLTATPKAVATVTLAPRSTARATMGQTAQPMGAIAIGARVKVRTDGAQLMGRSAPGRDKEVTARFDNGSELTVVEGPLTADGFTWWQVQGETGSGWSAADFLIPVTTEK